MVSQRHWVNYQRPVSILIEFALAPVRLIQLGRHHAFYFQDEHQEKPAADKTMADCVVFSARSFETITEFLPHCIGFEKTFVRDKHSNGQVGKLFYVVDGASDIFVTK